MSSIFDGSVWHCLLQTVATLYSAPCNMLHVACAYQCSIVVITQSVCQALAWMTNGVTACLLVLAGKVLVHLCIVGQEAHKTPGRLRARVRKPTARTEDGGKVHGGARHHWGAQPW